MRWVVKIGGSLHESPQLKEIVRRVGDFDTPTVIVPGGGPFADQVRSSQKRWGIDDQSAHAMALLAMRQYGYLLATLGGFEINERIESLSGSVTSQVWLPDEILLSERLQENWDVTSDSVAAWLANEIDADWLVLVKPVSLDSVDTSAQLVDKAFTRSFNAHGKDVLRCAIVSAEQWLSKDFSCENYRY